MALETLRRGKTGFRNLNRHLLKLLPDNAAAAPVNAVAAALTTALTGSNNDLVFTAATKGAAGNDITIAYIDPGTPSAALSVDVDGTDITVNLATGAGTVQVETATVIAAGGATDAGNLPVTVTSALFTPAVTVNVALDDAVHTTADLIAAAIRAALTADATLATYFTFGGTGADVVMTRKAAYARANDATENIAWTGVLGVTAVTNSANTTAGVAPAITSTAALIKAAIEADAEADALVTVANAADNDGTGVVIAMAEDALEGGINGTVGVAWEQLWYDGYLYIVASDAGNSISGANWYRSQFSLVS